MKAARNRRPGTAARPLVAPLVVLLLGCPESAPRTETGTLSGIAAYEGVPPRPDLIEPFGPEGAALDESLLVTGSGELLNVVAFLEVPGAPTWKREKAQIVISNNRASPRISFVSPGAEVEFKNGHDFTAKFISDFGAFRIPSGGLWRHTLRTPGVDSPMRWFSG